MTVLNTHHVLCISPFICLYMHTFSSLTYTYCISFRSTHFFLRYATFVSLSLSGPLDISFSFP